MGERRRILRGSAGVGRDTSAKAVEQDGDLLTLIINRDHVITVFQDDQFFVDLWQRVKEPPNAAEAGDLIFARMDHQDGTAQLLQAHPDVVRHALGLAQCA